MQFLGLLALFARDPVYRSTEYYIAMGEDLCLKPSTTTSEGLGLLDESTGFEDGRMSLTYTLALGFGLSLVLSIVTLVNFDAFSRNIMTYAEIRERLNGGEPTCCRAFAILVTVVLACAQTVFMFFFICNGFRMGMSQCPERKIDADFELTIEE